jgi:hypothetical protein
MRRHWPLLASTLALLSGCGPPNTAALKKLACEQAAASLDMQSVAQLDALRKALGVAPGVDPIEQCRSLGAVMNPGPGALPPTEAGSSGSNEGEQSEEGADER